MPDTPHLPVVFGELSDTDTLTQDLHIPQAGQPAVAVTRPPAVPTFADQIMGSYEIPRLDTPQRRLSAKRSTLRGNGLLPPTINVLTQPASTVYLSTMGSDGYEAIGTTVATYETVDVQNYALTISNKMLTESRLSLDDMIIEGAYNVYATGVGNVLGPAVVENDASTATTRIRYQFVTENAPAGLTAEKLQRAMDLVERQTAASTNYITAATIGWGDTTASTSYRLSWDTGANDFFVSERMYAPFTCPTPTPEQRAATEARLAKLEVVRQTAERLWLSNLSDDQRKSYIDYGYVDVRGELGRRYRLKNYRAHNVFLLDAEGREVRKYCAYANDPGGALPLGDHLYAQMVTLRYNEREFLRKANTWDLQRNVFVGQGADADDGSIVGDHLHGRIDLIDDDISMFANELYVAVGQGRPIFGGAA